MAAGDVAGDGETKAHAFLVARAGGVEAGEGAEGFLVEFFRDACAVVFDGDGDGVGFALHRDAHALAVRGCVVDQVGETAFERAGPARIVVFAPCEKGPWLDRLLAVVRRSRQSVRVVIGVDGLARDEPRHLWRRVLMLPPKFHSSSVDALQEVLRILGQAQCEAMVFDRVTGRLLGQGKNWSLTSVSRAA